MPDAKKNDGAAPRPKGRNVHIAADEVEVTTTMEVPEGHVVVEPPTGATPAVTMPEADARAVETAEQSETSLHSKGQRETSMLWELTQKDVALSTVRTTLAVAGITAIFGTWLQIAENVRMGAFIFLYGVANLVIGFYFGRTNHTRTGGPGGDSAGPR